MEGDISRTSPDHPWGSPSLLHNGHRVSFPGIKRPGGGVDHQPHLAPRLKKKYSYTPTPSHVLRRTLPLPLSLPCSFSFRWVWSIILADLNCDHRNGTSYAKHFCTLVCLRVQLATVILVTENCVNNSP